MRRKILDQHGLNFLTLTVVEWIDIFTRKELKKIVIDSLRHCQEEKGLVIVAYVIMSNHIHLIAYAKRDDIPLSNILRDFKKYTSKAIVKWIKTSGKESRKDWLLRRFAYNAKLSGGREYQVWQSPNYPTLLYTPKMIYAKINYIHQNPVRNGTVFSAEHYQCSSASNYVIGKGILTVEIFDTPIGPIDTQVR